MTMPTYLITARRELLSAQSLIGALRAAPGTEAFPTMEQAVARFYAALDRVHAAQIMANGVYGL